MARAAKDDRRQVAARDERADKKEHGLCGYPDKAEERKLRARRGCFDGSRDDCQNEQAEHVVYHRRAEDDARLSRLQAPHVLEHARRNPDARRAEGRADEDVREARLLRQKIGGHAPAQKEG